MGTDKIVPDGNACHQEFQIAPIIPQRRRIENRALDVFRKVCPTTLDGDG
jgi:hypothetical protein